MASTATRVSAGLLAAGFAAACIFFLYYCIRLAIVWSTRAGHAAGGAYVGAVVFPLAVVVFGWLSRRCLLHAMGRTKVAT